MQCEQRDRVQHAAFMWIGIPYESQSARVPQDDLNKQKTGTRNTLYVKYPRV